MLKIHNKIIINIKVMCTVAGSVHEEPSNSNWHIILHKSIIHS